jgi:hypothetical protein
MHAVISTWRLLDHARFDELVAMLQDRMNEGGETHLPGHRAGYAIHSSPDELTLVNVYEGNGDAETASHALMLIALNVLEGRAELIQRKHGAATDLQAAILQ